MNIIANNKTEITMVVKHIIVYLFILVCLNCSRKVIPLNPLSETINAPTNLQAITISNTQIHIVWNDNSNNEDGFRIERKCEINGIYTEINISNDNISNYNDTGLNEGSIYYYRVRAYRNTAYSNYSNVAYAITQANNTGKYKEMVLIPEGTFQMGDNYQEGYIVERPIHNIYLDEYYFGKYEVTNELYCQFLNSNINDIIISSNNLYIHNKKIFNTDDIYGSRIKWNGSEYYSIAGYNNHPVVNVTWYGTVEYCNWLSIQNGYDVAYDELYNMSRTKNGYRLPTEAEWEKAARGGLTGNHFPWPSTSSIYISDIDGSKANYRDSGDPYDSTYPPYDQNGGPTTPVGYYNGNQTPSGVDMANGYGLYDMAGNVDEMCNDWYDGGYYNSSPSSNPEGPIYGSGKVIRGGSWSYNAFDSNSHFRCAYRLANLSPDYSINYVGFRVARTP